MLMMLIMLMMLMMQDQVGLWSCLLIQPAAAQLRTLHQIIYEGNTFSVTTLMPMMAMMMMMVMMQGTADNNMFNLFIS